MMRPRRRSCFRVLTGGFFFFRAYSYGMPTNLNKIGGLEGAGADGFMSLSLRSCARTIKRFRAKRGRMPTWQELLCQMNDRTAKDLSRYRRENPHDRGVGRTPIARVLCNQPMSECPFGSGSGERRRDAGAYVAGADVCARALV
jgi:hypothetical protein